MADGYQTTEPAPGVTLAALLDELARRGLRVSRVVMAGVSVCEFEAVPAENVTATVPARAEDAAAEPDALERFINRKEPRA